MYSWLDGKEGWLRRALEETEEQVIYLDLIQTSEAQGLNPETQKVALGLAHLPWELLHDGTVFLRNKILPVRSVQQRTNNTIGVQNRFLRLLFMATSPQDIQPILDYEQEEANILQATEKQPLGLVVEESGSVEELGNLVQSYPEVPIPRSKHRTWKYSQCWVLEFRLKAGDKRSLSLRLSLTKECTCR